MCKDYKEDWLELFKRMFIVLFRLVAADWFRKQQGNISVEETEALYKAYP